MSSFYAAFEERHRGSRALISSRLCQYLPFLFPLKELDPVPKVLDLGCGRGEWLELLAGNGFLAEGVDIDSEMLESASKLGLKVSQTDAIAHLRRQADQSILVVSAFHLVEHLPFADVQVLIEEALRVLMPGGLLILETPNPENLVVGATNFYLDPTHQRPIPPPLLEFAVEHAGFEKIAVVRLQEPPELRSKLAVTIDDVLSGVSPDYSIVAEKPGSAARPQGLEEAFITKFGLDRAALTGRFEERLQLIDKHEEISTLSAEVSSLQKSSVETGENLRALSADFSSLQKSSAETGENLRALSVDFSSLQMSVERARAQLEAHLQVTEARGRIAETALRQIRKSLDELIRENDYRKNRAFWEKFCFRLNGRPAKPLRVALFHSNGKPRGVFRKIVLDSAGQPRKPFRRWMTSQTYLALPRAVQPPPHEGAAASHQPVWRSPIDVDAPDEADVDTLMERIRAAVAATKSGAIA